MNFNIYLTNSFHFPAKTRARRCLETLPRTLTVPTPGPGDPRSPVRIGDGAGAGTETGGGGTRGIGGTPQQAVTQVGYIGTGWPFLELDL